MRQLLGAAAFLALAACGPPKPTTGSAVFRFSISSQAKSSPNLKDPLFGVVYGNIFLSEDVTLSGPIKDAPEFGGVEVADVDLRTTDPSTVSVTTPQLAPNLYTFLGFWDLDANGATTKDPDAGDLATLPTTNQFEIEVGVESKKTVVFDLVYN